MAQPSTVGTTFDAFGRPVVSKPAGASNDIVHLGTSDTRTVSHTGEPLNNNGKRHTAVLPDHRHLLSELSTVTTADSAGTVIPVGTAVPVGTIIP